MRTYNEQIVAEALLQSMRDEGLTPREDVVTDASQIELTPREMAVAKKAAELAITELADKFYRQVGETLVKRFLVWLGLLVVGIVLGGKYAGTMFGGD